DGFLHRVLLTYPDTVLPRAWTGATISVDAEAAWQNGIVRLATLRALRLDPLPLNTAATAVWRDFFAAHNAEVAGDLPYNLIGLWAKLRGYCARLALIVHLLRWACGEVNLDAVDEVSMRGAIALVDYFKAHGRRIYQRLPATAEDQRGARLLAWIRKKGGTVKLRDVYRNHYAKSVSEADGMLRELVERGLGTIEDHAHGSIAF